MLRVGAQLPNVTSPAIDWTLAARLGAALVPAGPQVGAPVARDIVADLHRCAAAAVPVMVAATELVDADPGVVRVVDRTTWIHHNVDLAARLLGTPESPSLWGRVTGVSAGAQLGLALPLVAPRVLGQYDPFAETPTLLLVAPNVAQIAESLGVDRHAFSMWVCVHEVTHRLQFGQAPWLVDHLRELLRRIVGAESAPLAGWRPGLALPRTLAEVILGKDGKTAFDEVTAVMSLLEGHADVMMDRTDAVPGVAEIRARFQARRRSGGFDAVVRALTGLDVKQAQYREGAAFCHRVIERVGVPGLNRAFAGPAWLPTRAEIVDPDLWVARTTTDR